MNVGIRELRADLSRWVKRVREGEEVVVTDRGKPVARLVPVSGESKLDRLIATGLVEPAPRRRVRRPGPPIRASGTVSDIVLDDRR